MAFVNEWIPQEDIDKYGIIELKDCYLKKDFSGYRKWMKLHWCVDRERDIWFSYMNSPHLNDPREGWTGEDFFILHYQGQNIEIVMHRVSKESSVKFTDNPFRVVWKLIRINSEDVKNFVYEEVVSILKEALNTYGWMGIQDQKVQGDLLVELRI